ncbi:MAG: acyl carrier protein [Bryobacteraceae bacterium]
MQTKGQVAERLVNVMREAVLDGSDRDIETNELLGEEGVGLDSLAMVQFLTAVEQQFRVEIPVDVWSRVGQLTLDDCAEAVLKQLP